MIHTLKNGDCFSCLEKNQIEVNWFNKIKNEPIKVVFVVGELVVFFARDFFFKALSVSQKIQPYGRFVRSFW